MTDPAAAARTAATILAPDLDFGLPAAVEAALATRGAKRPDVYLDPISLASLIVSIASLAWTIYNDHYNSNDRRDHVSDQPEAIARQVRITLRDQDIELSPRTERIIEIVTTEITRPTGPPN